MKRGTERRQVGVVSVDSGQVVIIDPCYLDDWKGGDPGNLEDQERMGRVIRAEEEPANDYDAACCRQLLEQAGGTYRRGGREHAVVSATFAGDGAYPVFAEFERGRVARLVIDFTKDPDGDDDETDF